MEQRDVTPAPGTEATPTPRGVFQREGEYWTLAYAGTVCRVRDATGMRHLAQLLARPGQQVAATDLIRPPRRAREQRPADRVPPDSGAGAAAARQRARVRVTRAVRAAMARIARHHAPLGEHLAATIKTGTSCTYAPDRRIAPGWTL